MPLKTEDWMLAWVHLVHAGRFLSERLEAQLRDELGISLAEQDLLRLARVSNGRYSAADLRKRLSLSKAGMSKMLERLERVGLILREPSPDDRRATRVSVTDLGARTLNAARSLTQDFVRENLKDRLAEEDILALRRSLDALLASHGEL